MLLQSIAYAAVAGLPLQVNDLDYTNKFYIF